MNFSSIIFLHYTRSQWFSALTVIGIIRGILKAIDAGVGLIPRSSDLISLGAEKVLGHLKISPGDSNVQPKAEKQPPPQRIVRAVVLCSSSLQPQDQVEHLSVGTQIWITWRDTNGHNTHFPLPLPSLPPSLQAILKAAEQGSPGLGGNPCHPEQSQAHQAWGPEMEQATPWLWWCRRKTLQRRWETGS